MWMQFWLEMVYSLQECVELVTLSYENGKCVGCIVHLFNENHPDRNVYNKYKL